MSVFNVAPAVIGRITTRPIQEFCCQMLNQRKTYRVTFDSLNATVSIDGLRLTTEGLPIRLETVLASELLLLEGKQQYSAA